MVLDLLSAAQPFQVDFFGPMPPIGTLVGLYGLALAVSIILDVALGNRKMLSMVVIPINFALWTLLFPMVSGFAGTDYGLEVGGLVSALGTHIWLLGTMIVVWWVVEALALLATTILFKPLGAEFDAQFDAWVTSPVLEELTFRLVLVSILVNGGMDMGMAIVVQAFAYSLAQIKNGVMGGLDKWAGIDNVLHTYLVGLCLGLIAVQYGLVYALAFHVAFDIIFDVAQVFTPSGE